MNDLNAVEILLIEDNPGDAELTLRALRKNNLANNVLVAEDGAEALDFFFCRGKFESRSISNPPKVVLLDLKLPKVGFDQFINAMSSLGLYWLLVNQPLK